MEMAMSLERLSTRLLLGLPASTHMGVRIFSLQSMLRVACCGGFTASEVRIPIKPVISLWTRQARYMPQGHSGATLNLEARALPFQAALQPNSILLENSSPYSRS